MLFVGEEGGSTVKGAWGASPADVLSSFFSIAARFKALEFLLTSVFTSSSFGPDHGHGGGRRRRRRRLVATVCAKDLLDLVVIFSFVKVFCANVCGQLFSLYGSSRCLYGPGLVHV